MRVDGAVVLPPDMNTNPASAASMRAQLAAAYLDCLRRATRQAAGLPEENCSEKS